MKSNRHKNTLHNVLARLGGSVQRAKKQMQNSNLLRVILERSDDATLEVLSRTPLWGQIKLELEDQNFWFQRTQSLVDLPPELNDWYYGDNSKQNWHQIYNIIATTRG